MNDRRALLSTLWMFASLNYLYCDLIGMMDPAFLKQLLTGVVGSMAFTPAFLLGASVLMQIPMGMVLLSRVLGTGANRWANVLAGTIMTLVQIGSLTLGAPTGSYMFFSAFEIATTALVVWLAWTWRATAPAAVLQLAR